jgi:hypothetical protein
MRIGATIDPGVCGFQSRVRAECSDQQNVALSITSGCEKVRALAARVETLDAFAEIHNGHGGRIHTAAREAMTGCCSGCVVPSGVFKATQVAAGLALPMECGITVVRENTA